MLMVFFFSKEENVFNIEFLILSLFVVIIFINIMLFNKVLIINSCYIESTYFIL